VSITLSLMQPQPCQSLAQRKYCAGRWLFRLFGLPFFLIGVVAGYFVLNEFIAAIRTATWDATPATIIDIKLHTSHGRKGSTAYSVEPKFVYTVDGKAYTGDRVREVDYRSFADGGSYHRDWHDRLSNAMKSGSTVQAWYSPSAPHRAVLSREIRWGTVLFASVFMLSFGSVGAFILFKRNEQAKQSNGKRRSKMSKAKRDRVPTREGQAEQFVQIFETPTDVQVTFDRGAPTSAIMMAFGGLIFGGVGILATTQTWFGLIFAAAALGLLYAVTTEALELHRRIGTPKQVQRTALASIENEEAYRIDEYPYYKLVARLQDGSQVVLTSGVPGHSMKEVRAVIEQWRKS
jgi:hypothetical protein